MAGNSTKRQALVACLICVGITLLELFLSNYSVLEIWLSGAARNVPVSAQEYTVRQETSEDTEAVTTTYTFGTNELVLQNMVLYGDCGPGTRVSVDVVATIEGNDYGNEIGDGNAYPTKYAILGGGGGILGGDASVRVPLNGTSQFHSLSVTVQGMDAQAFRGIVLNDTSLTFNGIRWLVMLAAFAVIRLMKWLFRRPVRGKAPFLFNAAFWAAFLVLFAVSQFS